jgi:YidC/Oxa1 family membrane protein insertase
VISFPAGLLVYWITTNFWTIVQQTIVRKRLGPIRPPSADGEGAPMSIMDRMLHRGGGQTPAQTPSPPPKVTSSVGASQAASKNRPSGPPPRSPRKKKKRSGRRR